MPTFNVPADFELPEGVTEGQEFSAVGTFVLKGGKLMIKAVDDAPIEGYEDGEDEYENEDEGENKKPMEDTGEEESFTSAVEKRMMRT
jgi:hypothetical protein